MGRDPSQPLEECELAHNGATKRAKLMRENGHRGSMPDEPDLEIMSVQQSLDIIATGFPNFLHIVGRILEELKDLTAAVEALNQPKERPQT